MKRTSALVLALLTVASCGGATNGNRVPPTDQSSCSDRDDELEQLLADNVASDGPGAAVVVMRRGEVLFSSCRGLSDVEAHHPVTMETMFRLASLSKQLTAMAVLILVARGVLTLDDALSRWLPEFTRIHPVGNSVTIRHLLGHTSGIPDYLDAMEELGVEDVPEVDNARVMDLLLELKEQDFAPGDRFEYSNSNYVLLAEVVARASGTTFSDFLESEVFEPLGMGHAVVRDDPDIVIRDRAYGYQATTGGYERLGSLAPVVGDGGIFASPRDFVAWERGLVAERLIPTRLYGEAFHSGHLNDGSATGYGLGWFVDADKQERTVVRHTGSFVGFRHAVIRSLSDGLTAMVFSNLDSFTPESVANEALRIVRRHACTGGGIAERRGH